MKTIVKLDRKDLDEAVKEYVIRKLGSIRGTIKSISYNIDMINDDRFETRFHDILGSDIEIEKDDVVDVTSAGPWYR